MKELRLFDVLKGYKNVAGTNEQIQIIFCSVIFPRMD